MEKPAQEIKQIRPWVRYWARTFDIYLLITIIGYPFGYLIGSTFPSFVNDVLAEFVFALILVFIWVFIESFLLITWGTTPGKWLLNVTITSPTGETLFFFEAIYRSFSVWWRGLAIGFPIVSLFTLINAHGKLKREGLTSWDRDGGFVVSHKKIGVARVIVFL
ncbi:MAG TPA: RDD family protein, partial [Syntrophorhabdaceae bacterium]|nr:RDD family protein [Syntrophorhabdaceae bacterium]